MKFNLEMAKNVQRLAVELQNELEKRLPKEIRIMDLCTGELVYRIGILDSINLEMLTADYKITFPSGNCEIVTNFIVLEDIFTDVVEPKNDCAD
jgi:hypothetical protein